MPAANQYTSTLLADTLFKGYSRLETSAEVKVIRQAHPLIDCPTTCIIPQVGLITMADSVLASRVAHDTDPVQPLVERFQGKNTFRQYFNITC